MSREFNPDNPDDPNRDPLGDDEFASMSERERDRVRKRLQRAAAAVVQIPPCAEPNRRADLEADDEAWLRWYFGEGCGDKHPFTYNFTAQQKAMIAGIARAVMYGGDQSYAASRGEGKTTYAERCAQKYVLQGAVDFIVLFGATGVHAKKSLAKIKNALETNERLLADYPEICVPIRALENKPNRAHFQLVSGKRHDTGEPFRLHPSRFKWCGEEILLPNVPGAPAAGFIIATRGLDTAVRGLNILNKRPRVAIIDDPDTYSTVHNELQAQKLEENIDQGIGGLGDQTNPIARVMITTIQSHNCPSARYTDPKIYPSFMGRRFRFLLKKPERMDLWDEYRARWRDDKQRVDETGEPLDPYSRGAHQFYLANRAAMDAGAEVANPHRFSRKILPDGSQLEVSALQHYMNAWAKNGEKYVRCELDNDPPPESGPSESGITATRVQCQLSGLPRKVIPEGCTVLVQGIDARKTALHWVVRAVRPDCTVYTIDYGIQETFGTQYGSDDGVDVALRRAILTRMEEFKTKPYKSASGKTIDDTLTLVDASWQTATIYRVCNEIGLGIMPIMGCGKSNGCVRTDFTPPTRRTRDARPGGEGWFLTRKGDGRTRVWLVYADADHWKRWEHDRWMTAVHKPGAAFLWGENSAPGDRLSVDEKWHHAYAHHIVSEIEVEEIIKGALKRHWKTKSENNHWLDASCYANVAAAIKGIQLIHTRAEETTPQLPQGDWFAAVDRAKRRRG